MIEDPFGRLSQRPVQVPFTPSHRSPNQPVMPLQPSFTPSRITAPSGRLSQRPVQVPFTPPQRSPNQPAMPLHLLFNPSRIEYPLGKAVPQTGSRCPSLHPRDLRTSQLCRLQPSLYSLEDGRPIREAVPQTGPGALHSAPRDLRTSQLFRSSRSLPPSMTEDPSGRLFHRPAQVSFTSPQRSPNQPIMPLQPVLYSLEDGRPIREAVPQAGPGALHSAPEIPEPAGYSAPAVLYPLDDGRPIREAVPQARPGALHSAPEIPEPASYAAPTVLYPLEDGRPIREAVPQARPGLLHFAPEISEPASYAAPTVPLLPRGRKTHSGGCSTDRSRCPSLRPRDLRTSQLFRSSRSLPPR